MRRDLLPVEPPTELVTRLALLVARRADLVEDWVRSVNRLRRLMLGISPVLERALTFTRWTPSGIRRARRPRTRTRWLRRESGGISGRPGG
jgi:hypothetical protein